MNRLKFEAPQSLPVYLLAGGRSSRFGSDKAFALVNGVPLARHVAEQFGPDAHVTLVADDARKYRPLGFPIIPDAVAGLGPMGGLLAACGHYGARGWFWLSGCDTLFADAGVPEQLKARIDGGLQAIAFKDDRWEPMPALYNTAVLSAVREQVAKGEQSLWRLIEKVPHARVPFSVDQSPVLHINTPAQLEAYLQR